MLAAIDLRDDFHLAWLIGGHVPGAEQALADLVVVRVKPQGHWLPRALIAVGGNADAIAPWTAQFEIREAEHVVRIREHDERVIERAEDLALTLKIKDPKVAILAAVETVNPKMQATLDAAALCKMADRGQIKGGLIDGPLAFDNAISVVAARTKGIKSAVAGQADILLVPDIESGNMLAKQLEYLADAVGAGIVLGARVPIVLTSRADSAETRTTSTAIAVVMAHARRSLVK